MREAIDSALNQTYQNKEVIVVNDGSSDGGRTEAIALSYGDKIRYFAKENGGVSSALNLGIKQAVGDYISWLSHDDVYFPYKLEEQVKQLAQTEAPIILYSDYAWIDAHSQYLGMCRVTHSGNILLDLLTGFPLSGCTMLIPQKCFAASGLFDERLRTTQDYDMWFRLVRGYEFQYMDKPMAKIRLHSQQGTMTANTYRERNDLYLRALQEFSCEEIFGHSSKSKFECYLTLALKLKIMDVPEAAKSARGLANNYANEAKLSIKTISLVNYAKNLVIGISIMKLKSLLKSTLIGRKLYNLGRKLLSDGEN